jgi:hypothetical protein
MARKRSDTPAPPVAGIPGGEDPEDKPIEEPERGPATAEAQAPERVRVEVDTLVERPGLDSGAEDPDRDKSYTFVAAGDLIPYGLEGYPRAPA